MPTIRQPWRGSMRLWTPRLIAPEADELSVLADLVEVYEEKHFPIDPPTPVEAIRFRMEQAGLEPRDLEPYIGSRGKVSEVLSGKQPLTLPMIRALHKHLGIPAEVLVGESAPAKDAAGSASLDWSRFPINEMAKRGWVRSVASAKAKAEESDRGIDRERGRHEGSADAPLPAQ